MKLKDIRVGQLVESYCSGRNIGLVTYVDGGSVGIFWPATKVHKVHYHPSVGNGAHYEHPSDGGFFDRLVLFAS